MTRVDLNADVGESYGRWTLGEDAALMAVVTSANVACGAHAGDATTMRVSCERAVRHGVRVGAQVGYRDLAGFGRRFIDMDPGELADDVVVQIGALSAAAQVAGTRVSYVKPHGALYNAVARHEAQAAAVVRAVRSYDGRLPVLGLPGSVLLRTAAAAGLGTVAEGFADRGYLASGALAPRGSAGALLSDPAEVAARAVRMVTEREVVAVDGTVLALRVGSVCVHGDTPRAADLARAVREALTSAGVEVG